METLGRWGTFLLKSFLDSSGVSIMICCISNSFYFRSNVWKDGRALCSALIIKPWLHSWEREKIKAFLGWKARVGAIFKKLKEASRLTIVVDWTVWVRFQPNRNLKLRKSYISSMKNDLTQIIERKVFHRSILFLPTTRLFEDFRKTCRCLIRPCVRENERKTCARVLGEDCFSNHFFEGLLKI